MIEREVFDSSLFLRECAVEGDGVGVEESGRDRKAAKIQRMNWIAR